MKIDKGIPIPPQHRPASRKGLGKWQVILKQMKPGDSVGGLTLHQRRRVYALAKEEGIGVTARKEGNSYRFWRK